MVGLDLIARYLRSAGLALLIAPALMWPTSRPADAALEFHCVETSRYKNLFQIFHDDPSTFFSYFNISRRPLPSPDACRALLVTGTIGADSADALLARVIEGRGWLAALYLSFDGTNVEQEAAMAEIVRQFSLKTYEVRGPTWLYNPDFAVRWTPAISKGGFLAAPASGDPSPLDTGITAFLNRRDRALRLDPKRYACAGGCRVVWSAGVNRIYNVPPTGTPPAADPPDAKIDRVRNVFVYRLDRGRLPAADDPILARPWDRIPTTPPTIAAALRKECDAEMTVAEGLESRVSEAIAQAAAKKLAPGAVSAIAPHLNALKRAGVRLQQCLAATHENLRLQAFQTHCPKSCNRAELLETFAKSSAEMLKEAGTL
jgi:hypothetical protein